MNKLLNEKTIETLKMFFGSHQESIKKAALPMLVVAALLFFWITGDNKEEIIENDRPVSEIMAADSENESSDVSVAEIYVDISGCVHNPGVYKVEEGTRLFEVIEKAGGLTEDADIDSINRAEEVYDGEKIIIYQKEELTETGSYDQMEQDGKININNADLSKLQDIPGVGPATAQKIIEYRESFGRFKAIEDIKNVSGIGDKTFESMREYITV